MRTGKAMQRCRTAWDRVMGMGIGMGALCVLSGLFAGDITAQTTRLIGNVLLDVKETPLRGAEILIPSLKLSTRSDSTGKFALGGIPAGTHQVTVRLVGYKPVTLDLLFKISEPGDVDFILEPSITELAKVDVKDTKTKGPWAIKFAEFDERRASGVGKFLTADYFEAQDGRPPSSFIQQKIAGINLIQRNGRRFLASARGCGLGLTQCKPIGISPVPPGQRPPPETLLPKACYLQVIVNGIVRFNGADGQPAFDFDELQAKDIIGLEYYTTATTPLQFRNSSMGSSCGTVVVWTKGG